MHVMSKKAATWTQTGGLSVGEVFLAVIKVLFFIVAAFFMSLQFNSNWAYLLLIIPVGNIFMDLAQEKKRGRWEGECPKCSTGVFVNGEQSLVQQKFQCPNCGVEILLYEKEFIHIPPV